MAQDEDAPWLAEAAPLRADRAGRPKGRQLLNIVIAVLALAAVIAVALLMLLGRKDGGTSEGYMEAAQAPLIEADPGPFKQPPLDREGLDVAGDGEVIHEAVRGDGVEAQIDMNALPEEPMGRPRDLLPGGLPPAPGAAAVPAAPPVSTSQPVPVQMIPAGAAPAAKPVPKAVAPAVQTPVQRPAAAVQVPAAAVKLPAPAVSKAAPITGNLLQIGAFSSEAKAQEEWARVAAKGGLTGKRIEKITNSKGATLWRVRGTAADPAAACKAIMAANGACEMVRK